VQITQSNTMTTAVDASTTRDTAAGPTGDGEKEKVVIEAFRPPAAAVKSTTSTTPLQEQPPTATIASDPKPTLQHEQQKQPTATSLRSTDATTKTAENVPISNVQTRAQQTSVSDPSKQNNLSESQKVAPAAAAAAAAAAAIIPDPQEAALAELRKERLCLTEPYHPYICPSDTSLQDARRRLETALEQTRQLRKAFTERVYGKYRVCLKPPPTLDEIVGPIRQDPEGSLSRLQEDMESIRNEKELEKKDSSLLQSELKSTGANYNIDHADQLMYMSAGLNLVILPEDKNIPEELLKDYTDGRGPTSGSGQRSRSISHAAATAGELILDRTRRAAALMEDRQKRKKANPLSGQTGGAVRLAEVLKQTDAVKTVGAVAVASAAKTAHPSPTGAVVASQLKPPPTTKIQAQQKASSAPVAKQARRQSSTTMSANSLLSLHPHSDQLDASKKLSAAAAALVSKRVGSFAPNSTPNSKSSTQWRLRHPHPESLGGRRRGGSTGGQFSQELLKQTLPPLPAPRDKADRKPVVVLPTEQATTTRARKAVETVLEPFDESGNEVSNANFMHHLWTRAAKMSVSMKKEKLSVGALSRPPPADSNLDPMVAFLCMRAVGLVGQDLTQSTNKPCDERFKPIPSIGNRKLGNLRKCVLSQPKGLLERFQNSRKRSNLEISGANLAIAKQPKFSAGSAQKVPVPVKSIRGGGGSSQNLRDGTQDSRSQTNRVSVNERSWSNNQPPSQQLRGTSQHGLARGEVRPLGNGSMDFSQTPLNSTGSPAYLAPDAYAGAAGLNALQLAHQLQTTTFRAPQGDVMANNPTFVQGTQQRQEPYEMASFVQPNANNVQVAANSLSLDIARSQAVAKAQAMFARDQRAATLLHGSNAAYPTSGTQHYQRTMAAQRPSAVATLLGSQGNQFMPQGQYSMNAVQTQVETQFNQPIYQSQDAVTRREANLGGGSAVSAESLRFGNLHPAEGMQQKQGLQQSSAGVDETNPQSQQSSFSREQINLASANKRRRHSAGVASGGDIVPTTGNGPSAQAAPTSLNAPPIRAETQSNPVQAKVQARGQVQKPRAETPETTVVPLTIKEGLKCTRPSPPDSLREGEAKLIEDGRFHEVSILADIEKKRSAIAHLASMGAAIPIPRSLVSTPFRESINAQGLKSLGQAGSATIPQDLVVSVILVWLWAHHQSAFQTAFNRSGRIDVDPDCKWLIQAAVEISVQELAAEISRERAAGTGPYTSLAKAKREESAQQQGGVNTVAQAAEWGTLLSSVEIKSASVSSRALMSELSMIEDSDSTLARYQSCCDYLDELRLVALQVKAQERALLANLIARKAVMTDSFSNAYVSSMVRAGEAIGHGKLFEAVQNEELQTSTMIPYDVFTDDSNEWEDPCKPQQGMSLGLSAEALTRRAHARAMIQKSLRRLQEKHSMKGGTSSVGPFSDSGSDQPNSRGKHAPASSPRPGLKRKNSISEPPVPPGTGSAKALSWNVFNPKHSTEALGWNPSLTENAPYGRHGLLDRPRALSVSFSGRDAKKFKKQKAPELSVQNPGFQSDDSLKRSTLEIPWGDVADVFQRVELPKKPTSRSSSSSHHEAAPLPADGRIFAPFCRQIDGEIEDDPDESDSDEDISEARILDQHGKVLEEMKQKLSAYVEARRRQQERRRSRKSRY